MALITDIFVHGRLARKCHQYRQIKAVIYNIAFTGNGLTHCQSAYAGDFAQPFRIGFQCRDIVTLKFWLEPNQYHMVNHGRRRGVFFYYLGLQAGR